MDQALDKLKDKEKVLVAQAVRVSLGLDHSPAKL